MTTMQERLPAATFVASDPRHLPFVVPALDLLAVALPVVVVPMMLAAWSPVLQVGVALSWLVILAACGGYDPTPAAADHLDVRAVSRAACGLALALWTVAAVAPGLFGDIGSAARAVVALTVLVPLNTLGLRRAAEVSIVGDAASGPGAARIAKDVVDRVGAAILLVLLCPLLVVLVVLVRLDSPGGAVFRQVRVGQSGRTFTLLKLRTMRAGAEEDIDELATANECDSASLLFKIRRDPRITAVGAVLRKYSLDELPQLVNVLRGEMSLVGPRPALPTEVSCYSQELRRRLDVRPGMTGLWQVSGRSDLPWAEAVRLDLTYVDNWSWRMDLSIAARTLGAVIGHRGAY